MKNGQLSRILAVSAFIAFTATSLFGQAVNNAQIHGIVSDPSGGTVAGAQAKVTRTSTGLVRTTVTGSDGSYFLPNLPVGPYSLEITATGFQTYVQTGIVLQVGENPEIDVTLKVGAASDKVEVNANALMVETQATSVAEVIDQRRIVEIPLNGRQATQLVLLSGAASNTTLAANDLVSTKNYANGNTQSSVTISVAGGQVNGTNYVLDGGDNNDSFSNVNLPFPFPDALQEFSVQTSTASARYGLHPGAIVSLVTKSGANAFHGGAFEFIRNDAVSANNWVAPGANLTPSTLKRNQYGGILGGPIRRDKLFFFVGFQGTRNRQDPPPSSAIVPTAAVLAGDFSQFERYTDAPGGGCIAPPSGAHGTMKVLNPLIFDANNHLLSTVSYNPQALNLLHFVPVSTDPCGRFSYSIFTTGDEDQGLARVDWNLSHKHTIFSRWFIADYNDPPIFDGSNILPSTKAGSLTRAQSLILADTYVLAPNLVNSVHLVGTRLAINRSSADNMINFNDLGVNIPNPVPNAIVISISGYFNVASGTATPGHFNRTAYQVADDIDWTHGRHQLSFGINWVHNILNELSNFQTNGQFAFSASTSSRTRDALGDFMMGLPNSFTQGNPEEENWKQNYIGLYIHDNFRLRSNLTVNAGLRWEPYYPAHDISKKGSSFDRAAFDAGVTSQVFTNAPPGVFYCGDVQTPCSYVNNHLAQFSPRVGVVWDPRGKGRQTIRAGYGVFFDNAETFYYDRFADNSPYGAAILLSAPAGGFTNPYQGQAVPPFPTPFPTSAANAYFPAAAIWINAPQNIHPTYVQNWNLTFEQQFGSNWLVSASYLGNKVTHLWIGYEANSAVYIPGSDCGTDPVHGTGTAVCSTSANLNKRRILSLPPPVGGGQVKGLDFSTITQAFDGANGFYDGMLLSVNHRFSHNFTLLSNYSWSHCISDGDFNGELTNSRQSQTPDPLAGERGNCGFDRRHIFNSSLVVSSPTFHSRFTKAALGNWQLATIIGFTSGQMLTATTGADNALSGINKDRPNQEGDPFSGTCPASGGGSPIPVRTVNCWFNTSAFVANPTGTFGNAPRNNIEGPGFFTFDSSLVRQFRIRERHTVQLRFEAFNVLNHVNLGNPVLSRTSSQFGQIRGAGQPRQLQAAFKYSF